MSHPILRGLLLPLPGDELPPHRALAAPVREAGNGGRARTPSATAGGGSARSEPEQDSLPLPVRGEGTDQSGE